MRKDNSEFQTSFLSEAGTLLTNKDYFAFIELEGKACWVLAQGLDSDREIESAELAVKRVLGNFMNRPTMSRFRIKKYIQQAHRLLQEESVRVRLKASLIMVVTDYSRMIWAGAGNTRMYHFRNGLLNLRSKDQSLAQMMADREEILPDKVDAHEERGNLLEYLGKPDEFKPFVSRKYKLADGDVILLGTSGLWQEVNNSEMLDAAEEAQDPAQFVDTLEEVLLSKQKQTVQNYTAAAIFVKKVYKEDPTKKIRLIKRIALILFILLLTGGGALVYQIKAAERQAEAVAGMLEHDKNGDAFIQDREYAKALKEYSEARNAAIKIKDKVHTQLIGKKLSITELITDGDTFVKDGDYAKAISKYEKAKKAIEGRKDFNEKELDEKINNCRSFAQILGWIKDGDMKVEKQDYVGARNLYLKAKKAAVTASFANGEKEAKTKLEEVEGKLADLEREKKQLDAEKLEKKGDKSLAEEDFEGAIQSYSLAQEVYQDIDMLEKVLGMERKITKAEEKLNPTPKGGAPAAEAGAAQEPPPAPASPAPAAKGGAK